MKTWIKSLFAAQPAARPTARLSLEQFGDRVMPSVTSALSGGVLTVTADANATNAAAGELWGKVIVQDKSSGTAKTVGAYDIAAVNKVVFNAGSNAAKSYTFLDATDIPAELNAGPGTNTFTGGTARTTFTGHPTGRDTFVAGSGLNVLVPNGSHDVITAAKAPVQTGPIMAAGLSTGTPTPDQLSAAGVLGVSLSADKKTLTLAGPSGVGFQLVGKWTAGVDRTDYTAQYTSTGAVTLKTGSVLGDVPLNTAGAPLTVSTSKSYWSADPVGQFTGLSLAGVPLNLSDPTGGFNQMVAQTGLTARTSGVTFGLGLGGDLKSLGLPLNRAVPYLYAGVSTGNAVQFGGVTASTPGHSVAVAIDVADPSIVAGYDDFGAGASWQGEIPYTPAQLPNGVADPKIYGNLYVTGAVSLGEVPVKLSGAEVIDLDANGDGTMVGLKAGVIQQILGGVKSASDALGTSIRDIKIGVNGGAALSTEAYGVDVGVELGTASAFYTPNGGANGAALVGFRGASSNPFKDTPLAPFASDKQYDIGGWADSNRGWGFQARNGGTGLFGFTGTDVAIDANSAFSTVHVHAGMAGMLGLAQVSLDGSVDWRTGNFDLRQDAWVGLNAGIGGALAREQFDLSRHGGAVTMTVGLDVTFWAGKYGYDVHGNVHADLTVTGDGHGHTSVSGHGSLSGGYTFAGHSHGVSLGEVDFDNTGCKFSLLGGIIDEQITW